MMHGENSAGDTGIVCDADCRGGGMQEESGAGEGLEATVTEGRGSLDVCGGDGCVVACDGESAFLDGTDSGMMGVRGGIGVEGSES